jgi:hypothetical protein
MKALVVVIVALAVVAAALFVAMFRRDDEMLGLAGLSVMIVGALAAVAYGGMDSS